MTCVKCGALAPANQKFCRSCGASLELTTQPLSPAGSLAETKTPSPTRYEGGRQGGNGMLMVGMILLFIGVAIGVVGKKLLYQDVVTVVGVLISLLGMFLTAFPYLSPPRRKGLPEVEPQPASFERSAQPKYLPDQDRAEYIPSITERTTNLLSTPTQTRSASPQEIENQKTLESNDRYENPVSTD